LAQIALPASLLTAAPANLAEALAQVDERMEAWASNDAAYNGVLRQVFNRAGTDPTHWQRGAARLQATLQSSGLEISLELLTDAELSGINGAYTAQSPDGTERIYLNRAWMQSASTAQIEAVLLEELGHAIDARLNGNADSPGDEGERFSALSQGLVPIAASFTDNDRRQIVIGGVAVAIETYNPPPIARSSTPAFAAATSNPFGLAIVGSYASPSLVDIDGDGDLDAFIGEFYGSILFFRNVAAPGATSPDFTPAGTNPFGLESVRLKAKPNLVDIDGDGDLDAFIGNSNGDILFFRNTALSGSTTPAFTTAASNPFGLTNVGEDASPSFVDIDGDGDLDAFIGTKQGSTLFFRNTATSGSTTPAFAAAVTNPFGLEDVGRYATPSFVDIDGDGDLDAFIGESFGTTLFFRNTASPGATVPAFAAASTNPFGLTDLGSAAKPSLVDVEGDGDLDLFVGNLDGKILFFRNTAPILGVSSPIANGTYGPGAVITLAVRFTEAVLVAGIPRLQLETGVVDRFATYTRGSGTNTLFFSYTVRPGDSSPDLDVVSAGALTLRGGTIRDASGNNASLALSAPGTPESLGAKKNLVIAGTTVSNVSSLVANGTYGPGAVITLAVQFTEAVLVSGIPRLQLDLGTPDRFATYTVGSGTSTLTFSYTVQPGDISADLDAISVNALSLNGGTIKDVAFGNNANLKIPAPGATGSLGANKNLLIDAVAPIAHSTTPVFSAATSNPFGLGDVGGYANPSLVDIDDDGDLDAFIGNASGNILFFRNTALSSSTTPAFATVATNPFGLTDVGVLARSSFVDIDGDGDLDAFIGSNLGTTLFFRNTALLGSTTPAFATAATDPFGLTDVGLYASPSFVDIDGDGDLDAFIGNADGNIFFFRNTAVLGATVPSFAALSTINPFGIIALDSYSIPTFADTDGDGDLDLYIGNGSFDIFGAVGNTLFFRNTALPGATAPAYAAPIPDPFGLGIFAGPVSPTFVDFDRDGNLDIVIGVADGNTLLFRNTAPSLGVSSSNTNNTYGPGVVITLTVRFSESVFVTGKPRLQLETGNTDRFATFSGGSGTNTLTFNYTIQAGDTSADLDVFSVGALMLNGATIRDAAGNNAVLTLAAPGSPASLATRKDLVIDTTASLITAGPTAATGPAVSGFSLTASEAVIAALRKADNSLLFPTALAANTSTLLTVAAQAAITVASLVVTDLAGNRITSATSVQLGTNNADMLNGTANPDVIFGFGGNDTLTGGPGIDQFVGGDGSDTYTIETSGDLVVETKPNTIIGGVDTVLSSLAAYTLTANVENLTLTGVAAINGTGNGLQNLITGNTAANSLNGGAGVDTLNGGAGIDTLTGGDGRDIYFIETSGDLVVEANANIATGGNDTVISSLTTYTLTDNVENLTLSGAAINGTGNVLNNLMRGNTTANSLSGGDGNDLLNGAAGNDTLTGGIGADTFRFDFPLNAATNSDLITDFSLAEGDRIELENDVFTALSTTGALAATAFVIGAATNAAHRVLYNSATGLLAFNSDASGAAAPIAFATLSPGLALTSASFTVT
jgi:hypothetical protein